MWCWFDWWYGAPFHVPVGHLYIFFGKTSAQFLWGCPLPCWWWHLYKDKGAPPFCNGNRHHSRHFPWTCSHPLQQMGERGEIQKRGRSSVTRAGVSESRLWTQVAGVQRTTSSLPDHPACPLPGRRSCLEDGPQENPRKVPMASKKAFHWEKSFSGKPRTVCLTKNSLVTQAVVYLFSEKRPVTSLLTDPCKKNVLLTLSNSVTTQCLYSLTVVRGKNQESIKRLRKELI